jgi:hypothetical protein
MGGKWTVNDKEDIHAGVVCMDIVRIRFFLGELYGISCCACASAYVFACACICDIGYAFSYGKAKQKFCITAGPECKSCLQAKILSLMKRSMNQ